jgi:hypothetical protein
MGRPIGISLASIFIFRTRPGATADARPSMPYSLRDLGEYPQEMILLIGIRDHAIIHVSPLIAGLVIITAVIIVSLTSH